MTAGGLEDDTGDTGGKKYQFIAEILRWRATATADHTLFTLLNNKGASQQTLTCAQLHKKAEKIACLLLEKGEPCLQRISSAMVMVFDCKLQISAT